MCPDIAACYNMMHCQPTVWTYKKVNNWGMYDNKFGAVQIRSSSAIVEIPHCRVH